MAVAPRTRAIKAAGRRVSDQRVAVIDIGSNSVRLVVFAAGQRAPVELFNEKLLCGLGRGVARSGRLDAEAMDLALENIERYVRLARAMKVARIEMVATAAVRDAANGPEFAAAVRSRSQVELRVISGGEEARLAASGVLSAFPGGDGLVADLGGGSLELVILDKGRIGRTATLPIGAIQLLEQTAGAKRRVGGVIDAALAEVPWLDRLEGRDLYAVGGSLRALARTHIALTDYPLNVVHQYAVDAAEVARWPDLMAPSRGRRPSGAAPVARERREILPLAAAVLERLVAASRPRRVVFSSYGLREGILYRGLAPSSKRRDPLIEACRGTGRSHARFSEHAEELRSWTAPALVGGDAIPDRIHLAACLLSDIGWRAHPEYRADQAYLEVMHTPLPGLDHGERAFVALAIFWRYTGAVERKVIRPALALVGRDTAAQAHRLGLILRLAQTITGGMPGLLADIVIARRRGALELRTTNGGALLAGKAVHRRFEALAEAMGLNVVSAG